jgi:hypothetical protein
MPPLVPSPAPASALLSISTNRNSSAQLPRTRRFADRGALRPAACQARAAGDDSARFTDIYRLLLRAARAEGIDRDRLPDFLDLEDGGERRDLVAAAAAHD